MSGQVLISTLKEWGVSLNRDGLERLDIYHRLLLEWNRKFNLMSAKMTGLIHRELFLDSLSVIRFNLIKPGISCADIGTGNGIPGLVLAMTNPDITMSLVESIGKKVTFLNAVVDEMGLGNVQVLHGRAEELSKTLDNKFDVVTFKAFGKLLKCMEMGLPFLKKQGMIAAYRGTDARDEVKSVRSRFNGFSFDIHDYLLPEDSRGRAVVAVYRKGS